MSTNRKTQRHSRARRHRLLVGEPLEQRRLLAVFPVTSAIDGTPGDLRSAVAAANATPGADTIVFSVTALSLTQGEIHISDELHVDGASAGHVTISQTTMTDRIFQVDDGLPSMAPVVLEQVTLQDGNAPLGGAILNRESLELRDSIVTKNSADYGGAIFNEGGLVRMDNSQIVRNDAQYEGGGIMNASGALEIINSEISSNYVSNTAGRDVFGGGIRNIGNASAVLEDSMVLGNGAYAGPGTYAYGGGIANQLDSVVHQIGSLIGDNYATHEGGGVWVRDGSFWISEMNLNTGNLSSVFGNIAGEAGGGAYLTNSVADVRDTTITGNITELRGGGISAGVDVILTMHQVEVSDNTTNFFNADGWGGGIYLSSFRGPSGPIVDITDSRIQRNNVDPNGSPGGEYGGGISARFATQLTLTNTIVAENKASESGGGIYVTDGSTPYAPSTTINDSTITNNASQKLGGGITAAGGRLDMTQSHVDANTAGAKGGGLFATGLLSTGGADVALQHSFVTGNMADVEGGGIAAGPSLRLTIEESQIDANRTFGRGGGLYATSLGFPGSPNQTQIIQSVVSNNRAEYDPAGPPYSYASAGGVWTGAGAEMSIEASTISGNHAERYGGGMMANESKTVVRNSTWRHNSSGFGGAAYLKNSDASLEQNTMSANSARENGGALSIFSFLGNALDITSSTISLNQADADLDGIGQGGGISVSDDPANNAGVILNHTIVADNFSSSQLALPHNDDVLDGPGLAGLTPIQFRFNLVGSRSGTNLAVAHPDPLGNIVGSGATPVDAMLSPLGNFGGPTETMVPQITSPAIHAGDPSFLGVSAYDQRRHPFTRAIGTIDIGAVEAQLPGPDFNMDGIADAVDINQLTNAIAAGLYLIDLDMDADGVLGDLDIDRWLCKAGDQNLGANLSYRMGDANLDGFVDGADFLSWNNHKFSATADWTNADFDANGFVDAQDFIQWNANKFQGPQSCNPLPLMRGPDPVEAADIVWALAARSSDPVRLTALGTARRASLPRSVEPTPHHQEAFPALNAFAGPCPTECAGQTGSASLAVVEALWGLGRLDDLDFDLDVRAV